MSLITASFASDFSDLDSIVMGRYEGKWYAGQALSMTFVVRYDKSIAEILNCPSTDWEGCELVDVIRTKIATALPDRYVIQYDPGPSVDPSYRIKKGSKVIGHVSGGELAIPGDGYVYVSSRNNRMFTTRQKFKVVKDRLVEIGQPYYYVGVVSATASRVTLFADTLLENPVAVLPKGSAVAVLLNRGDFFLVSTPWGLTGWVKILPSDDGRTVYDIFFAGD